MKPFTKYNIFELKNSGDARIDDKLHELWLKLSKQGKVSPSVTLVQNLSAGDELEGGRRKNYAIFGLSHTGAVGNIPVSLEGSLQFNNKYFSGDTGFSIAQANLSLPFDINGFSVTPQIRLRKALDKDNFEDNTDFGVSLSRTF